MRTLKALLALAMLAVTLPGCAVNRASATVDPSARLDRLKALHVVKHDQDSRDVHTLVVDNLKKRGFAVTSGADKPASAVDAIVTYVDRWMWDITMYMLELTINIRDPKTDFPLATGNSLHTSLSRLAPEAMVEEVLGNIFKTTAKAEK